MKIKKTILKAWKVFWTPRFTTSAIDHARILGGYKFEITSLLFEDGLPSFPSTILGYITTKLGNKRQVSWNQYGECFFQGNRLEDFDLVHPDSGEIDSAKIICVCLFGIIITIFCTIIWN